jgi:ATP phosphoribosyltransferase regulatory subunit HisZ
LEPEPKFDAELVKQMADTLRRAITEKDSVAVKEAAKTSINLDSTGRLKVAIKNLLTPEENEACRIILANPKQSQPQPVKSPEQITDLIISSELEVETETEPTEPEVIEDVE